MGNIYIGTSGFSYREWVGCFYPRGLKGLSILNYYASQFNTVELNNTFYQLPSAESLESWRDNVGYDFRFSVKANQRITHRKDFGVSEDFFKLFLAQVSTLSDKLGPILFQFPPSFGKPERLLEFISQMKEWIPKPFPFQPVIELRNHKLLTPETFTNLHQNKIHLCFNDAYLEPNDWPEPLEIVYIRLRNYPYIDEYLKDIAFLLKHWSNQGKECYLFFKHELIAPELAQKLIAILNS